MASAGRTCRKGLVLGASLFSLESLYLVTDQLSPGYWDPTGAGSYCGFAGFYLLVRPQETLVWLGLPMAEAVVL